MICPRCGTDNPIPEASENRCLSCGFSLIGEVGRHDIHRAAARQNLLRLLVLLAVLGGLGWFAWSRQWFGLIGGSSFVPSDQISISQLFGAPTVEVAVQESTIRLLQESTLNVDAVVLANQPYTEGVLAPLAPNDLVIAWGAAAAAERKKITVTPHDRSASLATTDTRIDLITLTNTTAVFRTIPGNDALKRAIANLQPGNNVHLEGTLVSGVLDGVRLASRSSGVNEDEPTSYLLYVTSITLSGKTIGLTVAQ